MANKKWIISALAASDALKASPINRADANRYVYERVRAALATFLNEPHAEERRYSRAPRHAQKEVFSSSRRWSRSAEVSRR